MCLDLFQVAPVPFTELSQFGGRLRKVWLYVGRFNVIKYSPSHKTIFGWNKMKVVMGQRRPLAFKKE